MLRLNPDITEVFFMVYGYIRVSSKDQNEGRQLAAMQEMNVAKRNIFIDKQSGKDFNRPQYKRLMKRLKPGDLLVVKSIDRLGRNYDEILDQWRIITKTRQADICVIDFPLLDTRTKSGDLTGTFIADLVLQILSYVAQTEREFIHQRQAEGIAAAKKRGVKFGRESRPLPEGFEAAKKKYIRGELSLRRAAELCGMNYGTFYNHIKADEYSYMKYTNKASSKTAISYGCKQVDEFKDEENEITKVFAITRDEWIKR